MEGDDARPKTVEGVEFAPWLASVAREHGGRHKYQCETCPRDEETMRIQGCGWVHTSKRTKPAESEHVGYSEMRPTVCPGYSTQLPGVGETIRAYAWAERGQLDVYTAPHKPTPVLAVLIDVLASSAQCVAAQKQADAEERAEQRRRQLAAAF